MAAALLDGLCRALHHRFGRQELIEEALTHPSRRVVQGRPAANYERLEFLGDRVLGLVVAEHLLTRFPAADAGELALRYNALVRREALVEVARAVGLGAHIRVAAAEGATGGREKPAILADCCEAVIGALFLDGGFEAAQRFILEWWRPLIEEAQTAVKDHKTALQEWAQERGQTPPDYEIVDRAGPPHATTFTVQARLINGRSATGRGPSRRSAEQAAAKTLLEAIL